MTVTRSRSISPYPCRYCRSITKSHTFPTAASPSRTSLTLLLGFGGAAGESVIIVENLCRYTRERA